MLLMAQMLVAIYFVSVCFTWQPSLSDFATFASLDCCRDALDSTNWDSMQAHEGCIALPMLMGNNFAGSLCAHADI